jgi:DNA-binding transcriptional ArsR family regulator
MAVHWETAARALLHPTIVRVLELCDEQARSPRQIAKLMDVPLGAVSYHVRALAAKDMLVLVDEQPRRGAIEHYYRTTESVQRGRKGKARPQSNGAHSVNDQSVVPSA